MNPTKKASWDEFLLSQQPLPYYQKLQEFLALERQRYSVYPPIEDVFFAFQATPLDRVRVVIVGQDPYHGPGQAHGLCFSVKNEATLPPSLKNIFKESQGNTDGDLTRWAQQGVLLLNTVLTVRSAKPFSHKGRGWETFTDAALRYLLKAKLRLKEPKKAPLIFLLWGQAAQKKMETIMGRTEEGSHEQWVTHRYPHHGELHSTQSADLPPIMLKAPHPSPLSVHRGFLGCAHFSRVNELLSQHDEEMITW